MTNSKHKINPGIWPLATLAAVFFTVFAGIVHIVSQTTLSFDEYTTQIVGLWTALAIGRGLAVKDHSSEDLHPFDRFLVTFPWTWAILVFVAVIGYVGTLGDSLSFNDLGTKLAILGGAFGIGRGIATAKRDVTTDFRGTQAEIDKHAVDQTDFFIENPEDLTERYEGFNANTNSPSQYNVTGVYFTGEMKPAEEESEETPDDVVAASNLKLAVANGEVSDPTVEDPEEDDDEPAENFEALDDVDRNDPSSNGITQAWKDEGTVEGTEDAPTTRYTPDPDTLP